MLPPFLIDKKELEFEVNYDDFEASPTGSRTLNHCSILFLVSTILKTRSLDEITEIFIWKKIRLIMRYY